MSSPPLSLPAELIHTVELQSAVLFLGAAASIGARHPKSAKIPDGDRLRDAISDRFLGGEEKEKPLTTVAELAINESNLVTVQEFVRNLFYDFQPADFHLLIPGLRWHAIVTTNYDLIIERAYEQAGTPLQELIPFVKDGQAVETQMKRVVDGVQYMKLHGCIEHYTDTEIPLILAREQYARHSTNRTRLFERFRDWGREFPIIFCGYSVSDPHIQEILYQLFDLGLSRPMYYIIDPNVSPREERYWAGRRVTPIRATFEEFIRQLEGSVSEVSRALPKAIGGGTSTLRRHYKVAHAAESKDLLYFLADDVDHVRTGMPLAPADAKQFYRGAESGWGPMAQDFDIPRAVTDSLVVDAILSMEEEREGKVELFAVKGPAGNGKTIVLKRAAWMAAHDYDKIVLFLKDGGSIRNDVIEEIHRFTQDRIFLFVDRAALFVNEIQSLLAFAISRKVPLTLIVAERDAEWNVRCEPLDKYGPRDFPVRYLSEKEVRTLLKKLEQHNSLGLLKEIPTFEDRVEKLIGATQRQLLVALHEATQGKAFEDIVFEEYRRIIPKEAQALYLDICTLNRLGVTVRAGLIARVSGINFTDFEKRLFRPLEHIVRAYRDKYIGDHVFAARHQHVAEMVFDRVLAEPEPRYDQIIRIMGGMNLDYSSDHMAFAQLVRGHSVSDALRSRDLGRAFYDAATRVGPREAFLLQQRAIFEMEDGGDLELADRYLTEARSLEPYNKSIQHSSAVLARKQAVATSNPLLRQRFRDRAKAILGPLLGATAEHSYSYHTSGLIALDELRDILVGVGNDEPDAMLERQIVDIAKDFERFVHEGLQKFPLNEHLLVLESDYRKLVNQYGQAETALRKAFKANPRQDWVAIRLASTLDADGKREEAKQVLIRCLQDNPKSKKAHYELALLYMKESGGPGNDLILDHLRRSFTAGDQNYDAQFWFAREAFLAGIIQEAQQVFQALRNANIPSKLRNEIRGIISDESGRSRVYLGDVATIEDAYMFVRFPDFPDNIFVHSTLVADEDWAQLKRGSKVACTVGFNMRGPTAASVRPLE